MKKYITKQSSIKGAGKGLFTKESFKKGEVIGLAHVDDQPASEIGRNHNHNEENPTAYSKKIDNKRYIYASKDLKPGEEITTNYRLQPELEQPEDFMRKGGSVLRLPNKKNSKGYSRSLSATNKLFTQNYLFAKPKSRKNKIYDPNAKYYQEGGPTSPEEWGQQIKDIEGQIGNPSGWNLSDYNTLQNKLNEYKSWRENTPEGQAVKDSHNVKGEYDVSLPKHLQDYTNAMMKARLAYANEFGNFAAQRMINIPDNPYQFDNGDTGTHYMASMDNYAVPQIQDENGVLQLGDYGPESNEAIRFDSDEDANYFAENYKDVSPGFIEADLDEDEIEEYRKGGYIVEEIDNYADGGEKNKCENGEYWNGKKCVPNSIMQKPSWNQEPVVNPAAYVSGYRGGNPRMSKYSFLNSDQGNIIGGGGLSFPKSGVHLNALGVLPTSTNDKQYFKGFYEAGVSKDFKNLNLGLGVNTAITGYPGENGFVKDPIKLQPKLNLRYNFQNGGAYTVKGSNGVYKKVNGKWQVDWNKSGNYQPLSKGDVKARTAVLDKMAKPLYDKDYDEMVTYKNLSTDDKINKFIPKKEATKKDYENISKRLGRDYKPVDTKLQSVNMVYPEKYLIGPGGGLAGLGMKASKAAFAFKPISYLPSVGKALTYHSVYDAGTEHIPNTVKLVSDKSEWNNDKSVELFKNLFKITSTAAGFSKYDKLKHFNRARNASQFIDKSTDANKDATKGAKMLKNFVTTFKKYGGQQF